MQQLNEETGELLQWEEVQSFNPSEFGTTFFHSAFIVARKKRFSKSRFLSRYSVRTKKALWKNVVPNSLGLNDCTSSHCRSSPVSSFSCCIRRPFSLYDM